MGIEPKIPSRAHLLVMAINSIHGFNFNCGVRIRTDDLQLMRLTSCQTALPRKIYFFAAKASRTLSSFSLVVFWPSSSALMRLSYS